jgi:Cu/Ag efflux protein CusF
MKTTLRTVSSLGLTLLLSALVAAPAFAAEKKEKGDKKDEKKARALPYAGTVKSVDKAAKQVTIATKEKSRTFEITAETKITAAGKPATLDDVKTGEEAAVSYVEKDGKFMANSLRAGPKTDAEPKAKGKKKADDKK